MARPPSDNAGKRASSKPHRTPIDESTVRYEGPALADLRAQIAAAVHAQAASTAPDSPDPVNARPVAAEDLPVSGHGTAAGRPDPPE